MMNRVRAALAAAFLCASPVLAEPIEMYVPQGFEIIRDDFNAGPIVRAGDSLYISGVVVGLPDGVERTPENVEAAIRHGFNAVRALLLEVGADWDNVAELTTYHVDMRSHQEVFNDIRMEIFAEAPFPAWTALGVEQLWDDAFFMEITLVAYLGDEDEETEAAAD